MISVPLAIVFLGETISRRETAGIALALASVAALAWESPAANPPLSRQPLPPKP